MYGKVLSGAFIAALGRMKADVEKALGSVLHAK